MAVYAIGDLQGCYDPFRRLLDADRFRAIQRHALAERRHREPWAQSL